MRRNRYRGNYQVWPQLGEGLIQPLGFDMNGCQSCGSLRHRNLSNNGMIHLNQDQAQEPSFLESLFNVQAGQAIGTIGLTIDLPTALTLGATVVGSLVVANAISKKL